MNTIGSGFAGILQFEVFVTPSVLLVIYYIGAVLIPVLMVVVLRRLSRSVREHTADWPAGSDLIAFVAQRRLRLAVFSVVMFLGAELIWRMMFEFMLAYFQIRDALVGR